MKTFSSVLAPLSASLLATALLAACSTAKVRILPGEDGVNRVVSRDIERDGAEEEAAKEAQEYCADRGQQMVVVREEKTNYEGSMNEDTRKAARNASKAAVILGGHVGPISDAGTAGYAMTSDRDYKAEFTFRCKPITAR
jgi:hypothetical protein